MRVIFVLWELTEEARVNMGAPPGIHQTKSGRYMINLVMSLAKKQLGGGIDQQCTVYKRKHMQAPHARKDRRAP
jgi:hypothetical protein